jgi:hypothetical protein
MRPALSLWFLVACSLVACKKSETTTTTGAGPVVLEIATLYPKDNVQWLAPRDPDPDKKDADGNNVGDMGYPGDPLPIVIGCDRRLGVDVEIENFTLRAPDACSDNPQCGALVIEIDPPADEATAAPDAAAEGAAVSGHASAPSLVLDLSELANANLLEGDHVMRPSLQLPNGKRFTHPYAFEPKDIAVTFTSDTCTGAGGAGGSGSSESDANGGATADAKAAGGAPAAP